MEVEVDPGATVNEKVSRSRGSTVGNSHPFLRLVAGV